MPRDRLVLKGEQWNASNFPVGRQNGKLSLMGVPPSRGDAAGSRGTGSWRRVTVIGVIRSLLSSRIQSLSRSLPLSLHLSLSLPLKPGAQLLRQRAFCMLPRV